MAFGVFDMRWPPYAADITLELHQHRQTKEAFVKVSYIGQVGGENGSSCLYLINCLFSCNWLQVTCAFCRINLYKVVVQSTAPWRSSNMPSHRTHWVLNSTTHFVTTLRAWPSPEHISTQGYMTVHSDSYHTSRFFFFFKHPHFLIHPATLSHYTSLSDYTRRDFSECTNPGLKPLSFSFFFSQLTFNNGSIFFYRGKLI